MAAAAFRALAITLTCSACTSIAVDARTFEGTRWHVTSINGRPTPGSGDYHVEFEAGKISGRFGCNSWGGRYSVKGETLVARDVIATQMACGDPAGTFERQGFGILNRPMHWTWTAGRKLTLTNGVGSIALQRLLP